MSRFSRKAVSPVIGIILMVAITVVLAAVVYIYVTKFAVQEKTPTGMFSFEKDYMPGGAFHYYGSVQFSENVKLKLSDVKVVIDNAGGKFSGSALLSELDPNGATGIVGEWHFQEGSGTLTYDTSGYGNDGTIYGATWTEGVSGTAGYALSFDGSDDYVDCGNKACWDTPDAITVEAWAYTPPVPSGGQGIVSKGEYTKPYWTLYRSNDTLHWHVKSDTDSFVTYGISLSVWHYFVVTQTGTNAKMYIDVELKKEKTIENISEAVNTKKLLIGAIKTNTYYFNGTIDEVRIYNRIITQSQIKLHYDTRVAFYFQDADNDGLFSSQDIFAVRCPNPGTTVSLVYTRTGGIITSHTF